jgi:hypothetical protein
MADDQHYDVVIIGTGAGGGSLGHRLATNGAKVLWLERGPFLPRERDNWQTEAVFVRGKYLAQEVWYDRHGNEFQPEVNYYVGGNTKFYGAALFRLRPEDFGELRHHGGISPAWPISYDDLEPYYTQAEHLYLVHGEHGEDPTEGPASKQYAYPAVSHEPRIQQLSDDLEKLGLHPFHFIIPFTVAAIATPVQMGVGDGLARWVYDNQPVKFAAIEMVPQTSSDVPETLLGHLNSSGEVTGGIAIPGLASWLSDPSTGRATVVQGLDSVPADQRPTIREVNIVHLCWDIMVGMGTLLFLFTLWYWASWIFRRDMPRSRWFLRVAAVTGVLAVVTMEAGWIVSEVGRQPWIVYNRMRVADAATTNEGVWITPIAVALLYAGLGTTLILVLRGMSRRARAQPALEESAVPYGPRETAEIDAS